MFFCEDCILIEADGFIAFRLSETTLCSVDVIHFPASFSPYLVRVLHGREEEFSETLCKRESSSHLEYPPPLSTPKERSYESFHGF